MKSNESARACPPNARVAVVGAGYTGLPLAVGFAAAGMPVISIDNDPAKIAAITAGHSYLPDVTDLELVLAAPRLQASSDFDLLATATSVVVCVPTPLQENGLPDLGAVVAVTAEIGPRLRPGMLVVLQSTVPPGTSSIMAEQLEKLSGMVAGIDFHVAHAPERIDPANTAGWTLANTPKLIGGRTPECTAAAVELFGLVTDSVVPVGSLEIAEIAKVFENTFRMVNIALTYELADLCGSLGVPVGEVIDAAATKPYGFLAHRPGPGVGGECIAVDPMFLRSVADRTGVELPLISQAYQRIRTRPQTVAARLAGLLRERGTDIAGSRVLVVGASYKPGVGDTRNAPAIELIRVLREMNAKVSYTDPMVADLAVDGEAVPRVDWDRESVSVFDCLVLTTPHQKIMSRPLWYAAPMLLDCWNVVHAGDGVVHL